MQRIVFEMEIQPDDETGKAKNITLSNLLSLLRVVGRLEAVSELLPPIPLSPYMLSELNANRPKRVRHAK